MFTVADALDNALKLLEEYGSIGLWIKSDDCSDNRRRRTVLREADWEVSSALRRAAALPEPDAALERDLRALVAFLEPLPDCVTDIMAENNELDGKVRKAIERATELRERASKI